MQVQQTQQELFLGNLLSLCGPISKAKLTVIELANVIHLVKHFLQVRA